MARYCPNCYSVDVEKGDVACIKCGYIFNTEPMSTQVNSKEDSVEATKVGDAENHPPLSQPIDKQMCISNQPIWTPPVIPNTASKEPMAESSVITVKDWLIILLLMAIPFVNIIMLIIWASSTKGNSTKSNFAKANLIWMAISIGIGIVGFMIMVGAMATLQIMIGM